LGVCDCHALLRRARNDDASKSVRRREKNKTDIVTVIARSGATKQSLYPDIVSNPKNINYFYLSETGRNVLHI